MVMRCSIPSLTAWMFVAVLSWPALSKGQEPQADQNTAVSSIPLPPVIHECDLNCNTLTLVNGAYVVPPQSWEHPIGPVIWRVESFTRESVALHRTFPVDQVFRGQISPGGDSLTNITIDGSADPIVRIAWGAALNTVYGSNDERDGAHALICTSRQIRPAMQVVENASVHDLNGVALTTILALGTGINAAAKVGTVIDSKIGTDGGRYSGKIPGSFVCRGLFARGQVTAETRSGSEPAAELTTEELKKLMSRFPTYVEWFLVKPLHGYQYRLTLLPSSIQLAGSYSTDFTASRTH